MGVFTVLFMHFTWLPVLAFAVAIVLGGIGVYRMIRKKPYKRIMIGAAVAFAVPIIHFLLLLIAGFIGFGPGLSE